MNIVAKMNNKIIISKNKINMVKFNNKIQMFNKMLRKWIQIVIKIKIIKPSRKKVKIFKIIWIKNSNNLNQVY